MTTTVVDRLLCRLDRSKLTQLQTLGLLAHLENHMTPAEASQLRGWVRVSHSDGLHRAISGNSNFSRILRRLMAGHRNSQHPTSAIHELINWANWQESVWSKAGLLGSGENWIRRWRRGGLEFFSGSSEPTSHLVICVAGLVPRMMMPLPLFLASIGDSAVDVLKIEQPKLQGYQNGVTGFASDFDDLIIKLASFVTQGKYDTVSVIGASSGGLPAVLIGQALDAEMLWVAGPLSKVGPYSDYLEFSQNIHKTPIRKGNGPQGPLSHLIIYGAAESRDAAAAEELSRERPVFSVYPVAGEGHNSLYPLAKTGELSAMLRRQFAR